MRHALAVLIFTLAACSSAGNPAGPGGDPTGGDPPGGNPPGGNPPGNPTNPGPLPSIGGCQIFPDDNAWNRDVSARPGAPQLRRAARSR